MSRTQEAVQDIADKMAQSEYYMEFCELPEEIQFKIWEEAEQELTDRQIEVYERVKEERILEEIEKNYFDITNGDIDG